jgi:hypothetical protein
MGPGAVGPQAAGDDTEPGFRVFLQRTPRRRLCSCTIGWVSFGGAWVHERGHCLATKGTALEPAILYLDVTLAPNGPIGEEDGYSGCWRWVVILTAHAGPVFYAGSTDPRTDKVLPLPPGKCAFNIDLPGCLEARASFGGPLLQFFYGVILMGLAIWLHTSWFPWRPYGLVPTILYWLSLFLLLSPGGVNAGQAVCSIWPSGEDGKKSDGKYILEAFDRRMRGTQGVGDV